jgi:hypothetical protein
MKMLSLLFSLAVLGANVAKADWGLAPPSYLTISSAISVSVAPGRWKVPTTNSKVQVAWFKDPNGIWHSQKMGGVGSADNGKIEVTIWGMHFFSIPGLWTCEVVVQTYPIRQNPPTHLFEIIAGPTSMLVGEPPPTPTPIPTPTPTATPTPSPTPTPTSPTPTPSPTSKDRLFK